MRRIKQVVKEMVENIVHTESQLKGLVVARKKFNFIEHCAELTRSEWHRLFRMTHKKFLKPRECYRPYCECMKKKDTHKDKTVSMEVMLMVTLRSMVGAGI